MNRKQITKGFDLLAPYYELLLAFSFGRSIKKAQLYFLSELTASDTILIFGGGSGWLLKQVLAFNEFKKIVYVDLSPKMISEAQKLVNNHPSVEFIAGSYEDVPPEIKVDAIITPFVLGCFSETELNMVIEQLKSHLNETGIWLFSDFHKTNGRLNSFIISLLYTFFNFFCKLEVHQLPDFKRWFSLHNFYEKKEMFFLGQLIESTVFSQEDLNAGL